MPRLLHIEDDPANRLLVRKLLSPAGFEVVDAADGLEGVKLATEQAFDLILVDIAIPGLDGYEVTLRLRGEDRLKEVPIVAITAEGSRNTSLSVGCDGFLQKPIDARTFVRTVEGYLKGAREGLSAETSGDYLRAQSARVALHLEQKVAELSAANQRLIELDQARKEFYRNISHELSTPMTPIVGYTKLLLDQELGPLLPAQQRAMRSVADCVDRLRGLIDNLLDITGIETGRLRFARQPFDLVAAVRSAIGSTNEQRDKKRQSLVAELTSGSLTAQGDSRRVTRAVEQLLENASKFSAEGVRHPRGGGSAHLRAVFSARWVGHASPRRDGRRAGRSPWCGSRSRRRSGAAERGKIRNRRHSLRRSVLFADHRCGARRQFGRAVSAYLDWNATSPPHPSVLSAMRQAASEAWANPSSVHGPGRRARDRVESARERLAAVLAVEARDVVFTGGGTEANHLALAGASCIVTSRLEHPSVVLEAERLARAGARVQFVEVSGSGLVEAEAIDQVLAELGPGDAGSGRAPSTVVAIMAANHETGVVQPLGDVARVVHQRGAWLHVDAVQLLGRAPLAELGVADSVAVAAHKIRGPKGLGALAWRNGQPRAWSPRRHRRRGRLCWVRGGLGSLGAIRRGLRRSAGAAGPVRGRALRASQEGARPPRRSRRSAAARDQLQSGRRAGG
jgi:signal transduction histidine kinase